MKLHNGFRPVKMFTEFSPPVSAAKPSVRRKNNFDIKPDEILADLETLTRSRWIAKAPTKINLADLCANGWSEVPFDELKISSIFLTFDMSGRHRFPSWVRPHIGQAALHLSVNSKWNFIGR